MAVESRLIQVFLAANGSGPLPISYVHLTDGEGLRCSCAVFRLKARCKHTRWVQAKLDTGCYEINVPDHLALQYMAHGQPLTAAETEYLVLHYGKVEVI